MKNSQVILIIIICCFIDQTSFAQIESDTLDIEKVEVVKEYEANVIKAKPIRIKPAIPTITEKKKVFDYDVSVVPLDIIYPEPIIRPFSMKKEAPGDIYSLYGKLGYGNLNSPYADVGYNYYLEDLYNFGIRLFYYAAEDTLDGSPKSIEHYQLALNGSFKFDDQLKLFADATYDIQQRKKYGLGLIDDLYTAESFERDRDQLSISGGIKNIEENDLGISYRTMFTSSFTQLRDEDAKELSFTTPIYLSKWFDENLLHLNGGYHFSDYSGINDIQYQLAFAKMGFLWQQELFSFNPGVSYIFTKKKQHVFPEAKLSVPILDNSLTVQLFSKMDYRVNNLKNNSEHNPFINAQLDSLNSEISKVMGLNVNGRHYKLDYELEFNYQLIEDHALYNLSNQDERIFNTSFAAFNLFEIKTDVSYEVLNLIDLNLKFKKFFFTDVDLDFLPYTPSIYSSLSANVGDRESNRWNTELSGSFRQLNEYYDDLGVKTEGNHLFDISIYGDYMLTKHFGIFCDLNNLLNIEYQAWDRYSDFGFNAHGGIFLRF